MNKEEKIKYATDQLVGQRNSGVMDEIFSTGHIAFENGKVAEEWVVSELAGELLLKQSMTK